MPVRRFNQMIELFPILLIKTKSYSIILDCFVASIKPDDIFASLKRLAEYSNVNNSRYSRPKIKKIQEIPGTGFKEGNVVSNKTLSPRIKNFPEIMKTEMKLP